MTSDNSPNCCNKHNTMLCLPIAPQQQLKSAPVRKLLVPYLSREGKRLASIFSREKMSLCVSNVRESWASAVKQLMTEITVCGRDATSVGVVLLPERQPRRLAMTRKGYYCIRSANLYICFFVKSELLLQFYHTNNSTYDTALSN